MSEKKNVARVEFCRGPVESIDVYLAGKTQPVSLFDGIIALCSENLSEREIEVVIYIATSKKRIMSMQRNFPQIYNKMLTELIEVQRKRYGERVKKDKKRQSHYSLSMDKLEKILEWYFLRKIHIDSIHIGADDSESSPSYEAGSRDSFLHVSFHEEIEERGCVDSVCYGGDKI